MSLLLLASNRSYLKFSIVILQRHSSTWRSQTSSLKNSSTLLSPFHTIQKQDNQSVTNGNLLQHRYLSNQSPPTEDKKKKPVRQPRLPFEFPPGKPTDKPKLEHLRFIENQLIYILPDFAKNMHPYGLYSPDLVFENFYEDPPKIIKGVGNYALTMVWIRTKLNFKLMNIQINLLKTTIDEESECVKIRWRISGLSNQSFIGLIKGWRKPKNIQENIRDYIEHIDGLSTFYVRGDGRIYKHRVDRMMVDEDKEPVSTVMSKKKLPVAAPIS